MAEVTTSDGRAGAGAPATTPRVLMPTLRRLNPHAAWCSNYEFEDVAREVDDVELLELHPASRFELRQKAARSLAVRGWHPALARLNPGVLPAAVDRDHDLFVFVCMNVWDLLALNALRGWRERCRVKLCYMVEFYAGLERDLAPLLRLLGDFDHVVQSFSGSVAPVGKLVGRPCHHVALAADVRRFTPFPAPAPRVVDVLSVGRRAEPVHDALLRRAARDPGFFYLHDTLPGPLVRPTNAAQHRDMLARSAKRAKLFVAYPAKFGDAENQGQSEVGARFYEGTAAGALLLGEAPGAAAFRADFPWADAVIPARPDGGDVLERIAGLEASPEAAARARTRNALAALRRHDWAHRFADLLRIAGLPPRPALEARLAALAATADAAERSGVTA